MSHLSPSHFDIEAFLGNAGLGRRIVRLEPEENFFTQGIPRTPSFIFRKAAQNSPLFRRQARKPPFP
jgi:hypothetical protein